MAKISIAAVGFLLALPLLAEEPTVADLQAKLAEAQKQLAEKDTLLQFWTQSAVSCQVQMTNASVLAKQAQRVTGDTQEHLKAATKPKEPAK